MVSGPYDLLSQPTVPVSVQMWALTEVPLTPLSYSDLEACRVPGLASGLVTWGPIHEIVAGVQLVRGYSVWFGPLSAGEGGAGIGGVAIVDVAGSGPLTVLQMPNRDIYLGPYPATIVLSGKAIIVRGGV